MRKPGTLLAAATALLVAGCAPAAPADDGVLRVVASTSVYGDIAATVAGDLAEVASIITSTVQDPHSYEVTARDRLAFERADLVVFNGGGYDPFVSRVLDAMTGEPVTVEAVVVAGLDEHHDDHDHDHDHDHDDHEHGADGHGHLDGVNEHLWYDLHAMEAVARQIADRLGALDPANADVFAANADAFAASLETVESDLRHLREELTGVGFVMTEPVPAYLLAEAGLVDVTPEGFSKAIEEGSDVSPALLASVRAAINDGRAALVAVNPQTAGPETQHVRTAAEAAGIPVVSFLEVLPEGTDYAGWMRANVAALAAALS